jgi:dATP/dGTP diphosphohydrolase
LTRPMCRIHAAAFLPGIDRIEVVEGSPPTLPSAPAAPVAHPEPPPVESVPMAKVLRDAGYPFAAPPPVPEALTEALASKHAPAVKATNPKDFAAGTRLPMHLVPKSMVAYASLAFLEGALKYGAYNWREAGVMVSVYESAIARHAAKFEAGEWADPKTGVPHLASIIASCAILLDASMLGKVIDDRPPRQPLTDAFEDLEPIVKQLKGLFGSTPALPFTHKAHPLTEGSLEDDTDR